MKRTICLSVIATVLLTVTASAQENGSRIEGIVSDAESLPLPGAKVVLIEGRTGLTRAAETTAAGTYLFASLSPGQYELRVEAKGFSGEVRSVTLEVDQALELDISSSEGTTSQHVQVVGAAETMRTTNANPSPDAVKSKVQTGRESAGFFTRWENRVRDTLAQQPSWPIPLVTASSGLLQVLRADFVRQIAPAGTDTWNYDNSKGLNIVPWYNVEFDVLAPPYIQHNSAAKNGFGDFSMLLKYRLAAGNETHGDYSVSFAVAGTLPTGSYKNGNLAGTVTPTLCAGKGFGRFDVQSTLGVVLPAGATAKLGRVVVWNSVGQYHVGKWFWPEIESNATFYDGGVNHGRVQNFVTPGLMLCKFKLERDPRSLLALVFGAGMQIATTQFHTYNHGLVVTARMLF
jgi:hypothetical protein